jgi:hypothetical protein
LGDLAPTPAPTILDVSFLYWQVQGGGQRQVDFATLERPQQAGRRAAVQRNAHVGPGLIELFRTGGMYGPMMRDPLPVSIGDDDCAFRLSSKS